MRCGGVDDAFRKDFKLVTPKRAHAFGQVAGDEEETGVLRDAAKSGHRQLPQVSANCAEPCATYLCGERGNKLMKIQTRARTWAIATLRGANPSLCGEVGTWANRRRTAAGLRKLRGTLRYIIMVGERDIRTLRKIKPARKPGPSPRRKPPASPAAIPRNIALPG